MQFANTHADIFIPDGIPLAQALARTTRMGIGAHQDDLEIMAFHGILECFGSRDEWFTGVTVTDGGGSPRDGLYADYTDDDMKAVRLVEQRKAAVVGEYAAQLQLGYSSSAVKDPAGGADAVADLVAILAAAKPAVVYTHNLADKHDTHVGVTLRVIAAIRQLDLADRPKRVLGCEVWRDLDWMCDDDKVGLDVQGHENLAASLIGVYDSQITGGKRYDLATIGRRCANATYYASHGTDATQALIFAMDLTPLAVDDRLDAAEHVGGYLAEFAGDVSARIGKLT